MSEDRTWLVSVLFMDIFRFSLYTVEQQLIVKRHFQGLIAAHTTGLNEDDLIQLDTGDGIAICYLGDPEKMYPVANKLRHSFQSSAIEGNCHYKVRLGLNLGPVKILQDMNEKRNCIGSGITDAERVMSFAQENQLLVSKSYYEIVSKMSEVYTRELEYFGCMSDKHDQPHEIYMLSNSNSDCLTPDSPQAHQFDTDIIDRIRREYSMYISLSEAESIINNAMLKASSLKQFCEILSSQIQSTDERFNFEEYLKSYGYSGY